QRRCFDAALVALDVQTGDLVLSEIVEGAAVRRFDADEAEVVEHTVGEQGWSVAAVTLGLVEEQEKTVLLRAREGARGTAVELVPRRLIAREAPLVSRDRERDALRTDLGRAERCLEQVRVRRVF